MAGVYPFIIRKAFEVTKADFGKQRIFDNRVGFMPADKTGSFVGAAEWRRENGVKINALSVEAFSELCCQPAAVFVEFNIFCTLKFFFSIPVGGAVSYYVKLHLLLRLYIQKS